MKDSKLLLLLWFFLIKLPYVFFPPQWQRVQHVHLFFHSKTQCSGFVGRESAFCSHTSNLPATVSAHNAGRFQWNNVSLVKASHAYSGKGMAFERNTFLWVQIMSLEFLSQMWAKTASSSFEELCFLSLSLAGAEEGKGHRCWLRW